MYGTTEIGVVLFSAEGPSPKDGVWSFCSGGERQDGSAHAASRKEHRSEDERF